MLMEPLFRLEDINRKLLVFFENTKPRKEVALVGILLARPEESIAKDKIIPNLKYWHFRSDMNVLFFCVGYTPFYHMPSSTPLGVNFSGFEWAFSHEAFIRVIQEVERQSGWKYIGDPTLMLLNARCDTKKAYLDFSHHLRINLKEADRFDQTPTNISEAIFEFASSVNADCDNPVWVYSDKAGCKVLRKGLKEWFLNMLPKALARPTKEALIYAIHETSSNYDRPSIVSRNNIIRINFKK